MRAPVARPMEESEFIPLAEPTLQELNGRVDVSGIDADCEFKGAGVLESEFGDCSMIIVTSPARTRAIRDAAKSGGCHFRCDGRRWVNGLDGGELFGPQWAYVSLQAGASANLVTDSVQSMMGKAAAPARPFPITPQNNWVLISSGLRVPPSGTSSLGAMGTFSR